MTDINLSPANEPPPRLHSNQTQLQHAPQEPKLPPTNAALSAPRSSPSPPPLKVSESMRRIQDMLSARKLTTSDLLTYTHNSVTFTAQILADGSLKASVPHPRNPQSSARQGAANSVEQSQVPNRTQFKLYSSPTDFASDMASSVAASQKSRGSEKVNGWTECRVNGRPLSLLRNEMLRSKKTEPSEMARSPRSTRTEPVPDAAEPSPAAAVEAQPPQPVTERTDNHPDGSQDKTVQLVRSEQNTSDPRNDSKKDLQPSKHQLPARTSETGDPSPGEEHSEHVLEQAEKSNPNRDSTGDGTAQLSEPAIDAVTRSSKSASPTGKPEPGGSKVDVDTSDNPNSSAKNGIAPSNSDEANVAEARRSVAKPPEPAMAKEPANDVDKPEERLANPEHEYSKSPNSEKGNGRGSAKDSTHKNTKKRMRSPAKQDAKKRKKKHRSDSPPSGARTPSSRRGEKRSKEGKSADLASAVDVDMVELDPEAREAAAIAAQAEKEEANSRARRTTRLAAGKIKQVDYKASANPQSIRTYSPGHENEDPDGNYHSNEATDAPKSSRRRAAQNHSGHQLRTSRRLTRQRGSYDREVSSNDELDQSGWRSGGNSGDKKHTNHEDNDEVVGTSRTNGIRNDRKRSRPDSRRGRSNHSSDMDRGNCGSRESPDNGSPDLPDDDEDLNEEEDLDDDEDPENRTNGFDLNMQDLKCIGTAMREANSLDPSDIIEMIQEQADWKYDDHKNKVVTSYVEKITSAILNLKHLVSSTEEDITIPEALAFVATDFLRLRNGPVRTGYARRPTAILNRAQREEHIRTSIDRHRRKEQRDADEARASLERDMESRRKSEIDTFYTEALLSEVMGHISREEDRCRRIQREIARYEALEGDVKARFDKAKLVHEKLQNERRTLESPPASKNEQQTRQQDEDEVMTGDIEGYPAKRRKLSGGTGAISDDGIVGAMDNEVVRQLERAKEMARLQALIASRQAEIEDYQRMCVESRMTFASIADAKSRLETELHVLQSVAFPGGGSGGQSSPVAHFIKPHKESGRKNEHKSGSSGGRNAGNSRSKPHGRGSGSGTPSRPNGSSKTKTGNGRHGENGNRAKRKASNKHS